MAIIDCITYNGEADLFDLRYNVLKDFVDEFRVIQFDTTFSGRQKECLDSLEFPKVKTYINTEKTWGKYRDLAISSPNTEYGKGAEHWITEFCQKESIKDCLTDLQDDDIVYIGDCDEIYEELSLNLLIPVKLKLRVYQYYLNNRSNEEFHGTLLAFYEDIKNECLNHLRANAAKSNEVWGGHFTSMGGASRVKDKLLDSYTEQTYASKPVLDNLENNINNNKDFLSRDFEYRLDESEWPEYLKDNKDKYKHLMR